MNTLLRIVAIAIATAVAVWLVPGIYLTSGDTSSQVITLLVVAAIIAIVNGVAKPLAKALSACVILLTFGLFLLVINAAMLLLASWLSTRLGFGFHVEGFWPALWGSLVISIVSSLAASLLGVDRD